MKEIKNEIFDSLIVVKRSGQRTSFDGEKIAIAIKKAFDNCKIGFPKDSANAVYKEVLKEITKEYQDRKTIKIEDIQDIIEVKLRLLHFDPVYEGFKNYRERRALSRETFVIKQQHKFLKAVEKLGMTDSENIDLPQASNQTAKETLTTFGSIISKEFAKAYLLDNKYIKADESGLIHIAHLETISTGSPETIQLDLERIAKENNFFETFETIGDYIDFITSTILAASEEVSESISLEGIDYFLASAYLKTMKKNVKEALFHLLDYQGIAFYINKEKITKKIDSLTSLPLTCDVVFEEEINPTIKNIFEVATKEAEQKTAHNVKTALKKLCNQNTFFQSLHPKPISMTFGTCTSFEGNFISKVILEILTEQTSTTFPKCFFKLAKKINIAPNSPNYDLYVKALQTIPYTNNLYFIDLDTPYNKKNLMLGDYKTECSYTIDGKRVYDDATTTDAKPTGGKGNLFTIYLNLSHLALKTMNKKDFYEEVDTKVELAANCLLEIFDIACKKHSYNYPYLIEKGIWQDGEKVKPTDRLRKVLKHGTLCINLVGLWETVLLLKNAKLEHDEEAEIFAVEIIKYIRQKCNQTSESNNLNIVLSLVYKEEISKQFINIDKTIFGEIKGVTTEKEYRNPFRIDGKDLNTTFLGKLASFSNGGSLLKVLVSYKEIVDQTYLQNLIKKLQNDFVGCFQILEKEIS